MYGLSTCPVLSTGAVEHCYLVRTKAGPIKSWEEAAEGVDVGHVGSEVHFLESLHTVLTHVFLPQLEAVGQP